MNNFESYICSFDFLKDIILILLGMFITMILGMIKKAFEYRIRDRKIKKIISKSVEDDIVGIDHAEISYSKNDIITKVENEQFFLSIPNEYRELILQENELFSSRQETIFNDKSIDDLAKEMGIHDLKERIERCKVKTAEYFLNRLKQGMGDYNNMKYGVKHIICSRDNQANENSIISISFYTTDYYTHKVMREVYKELYNENSEIRKVRRANELNKFYPFGLKSI